ncbi:hypothetical protein [Rhizobium sp. LjRoot258]
MWTYGGKPLYTYVEDKNTGETTAMVFGG